MIRAACTCLLVALAAFVCFGQEPAIAPADPMAAADALYASRADGVSLAKAITAYEAICAKEPANYDAHWKLARCMYLHGEKEPNRAAKQVIFQKGIDAAKAAVAAQPGKAEGHFWLGVCYGTFGEAKGVMKSLGMVGPIKTEMAAVLRIDPNCEDGGADRVLGRLFYRLPWLAGGSKKKSLEHLLKSEQLAPTNTLTKLYLGDTYWSLGEKDKARKKLEDALAVTPDPDWIPETEADKKEARRRLDNIAKGKKPSEGEDAD